MKSGRRARVPNLGAIIATIAPGLEHVLADELRTLGLKPEVSTGVCRVPFSWENLACIEQQSRVAAGLLVRLGRVRAPTLEALADSVRKLPWKNVIHPTQKVVVDVSSHRSRLKRKDAVSRKVGLAIRDALRGPRRGGRPVRDDVRVVVRLVEDKADISLDAIGERMHRRGWRRQTGRAPIRENLAAAILWSVGWRPGMTLVDPMCGSGTFPIEAATWARGLAPGAKRRPASWRRFPAAPSVTTSGGASPVLTTIMAGDRDAAILEAAQSNARRAGVDKVIRWNHVDATTRVPPDDDGWLVANPPYGGRLGTARALGTWSSLGRALRSHWVGWNVALVAPSQGHIDALGIPLAPVIAFNNGGIPVTIYAGRVEKSG